MSKESPLAATGAELPSASALDAVRRPPSRGSIALRIVAAALVSLVFVYLFATHLNFAELTATLHRANAGWLVASIVVLGAANLIRAERFRLLDGGRHDLSYWWFTTQTYNVTTSTLPGGLGELVTAYLFRRSSFVGWAGAFRLFVVARLIDVATLLGIYAAAMGALGLAWATPAGILTCSVSAALVLVALVLLLPRTQTAALSLMVRLMPMHIPLLARVRDTLQALIEAARSIDRRAGLRIAGWSALMGLLSASIVSVLLLGFGERLGLLASFAAYGLYVLLQLIPLQGLAGVGTQSARWTIALIVVGVRAQQAAIDGVALYISLYAIIALWALLAAGSAGLRRLRR